MNELQVHKNDSQGDRIAEEEYRRTELKEFKILNNVEPERIEEVSGERSKLTLVEESKNASTEEVHYMKVDEADSHKNESSQNDDVAVKDQQQNTKADIDTMVDLKDCEEEEDKYERIEEEFKIPNATDQKLNKLQLDDNGIHRYGILSFRRQ